MGWGQPSLASPTAGRSGLGFKTNDPAAVKIGTAFNLGTLRHFNWTIGIGSFGTGSRLTVDFGLVIDGVAQGPNSVSTDLTVDETINSTTPCLSV